MVLIEGMPYTIPMIYLKLAGNTEIVSIPFWEAVAVLTNVSYDYRASQAKSREAGQTYYVIKGDDEIEKNKIFIASKDELMKVLQRDIYQDKFKITDMAIQPEDERLIEEVRTLIGT